MVKAVADRYHPLAGVRTAPPHDVLEYDAGPAALLRVVQDGAVGPAEVVQRGEHLIEQGPVPDGRTALVVRTRVCQVHRPADLRKRARILDRIAVRDPQLFDRRTVPGLRRLEPTGRLRGCEPVRGGGGTRGGAPLDLRTGLGGRIPECGDRQQGGRLGVVSVVMAFAATVIMACGAGPILSIHLYVGRVRLRWHRPLGRCPPGLFACCRRGRGGRRDG